VGVETLGQHLGIDLINAAMVVISASVLYVTVGMVIRGWGRRLNASASVGTIALVTLVGSIAARATLGSSPDLLGGLVAIGTLVVLERFFGRWSAAMRGRTARLGGRPVVLMVGDLVLHDQLARFGMHEHGLRSLLRQQGIWHGEEVGVVILEPRGAISALRAGQALDRSMVEGVEGAERLPAELFRNP
jgi:uncharacterized membrane protein YcaP (DUF421 family)